MEVDKRPAAAPQFYSFRELPADPDDAQGLFREMAGLQRANGATFLRFTVVSPEYPLPPYPDGLWVEGWEVDPALMTPQHRQSPFAPPVTAA